MLQHDLRTAIVFLENSTAAIDRQSEGLRAQRKHLESLQRQRQLREDSLELRARQLASQNLALAVGKILIMLCYSHGCFAGGRKQAISYLTASGA